MPAIVPQLPSPATGQTQRERLSRHSEDAACSGCHQLMDPVGFAFSAFDTLGRFRPDPGGTDSSGYVLGLDGGDRTPFSGLGDFMALLSHSQNAQSCAVQQWFQFALARPTTPDDGPILDQAWRAFASSGQDVRELLIFLVRSPAFATRTTAGVTP